MRIFDNMRVGTKLTGGFLIVALILVIVAAVGYSNLKQVAEGTTSMYFDRLKPIEELGLARTALYTARGHLYKAVVELDRTDEIARDIEQQLDIVTAQLELYRSTNLAPEEKVELAKIDAAWPAYRQGVTEDLRLIRSGDTRTVLANLAKGGSTSSPLRRPGYPQAQRDRGSGGGGPVPYRRGHFPKGKHLVGRRQPHRRAPGDRVGRQYQP